MENKTKILNLLGLAMRAGKLVTGEELTLKIFVQTKKFVFVAQDASENTRKKIKDKVLIIMFLLANCSVNSRAQPSDWATTNGYRVTDAGFATKIKELLKG